VGVVALTACWLVLASSFRRMRRRRPAQPPSGGPHRCSSPITRIPPPAPSPTSPGPSLHRSPRAPRQVVKTQSMRASPYVGPLEERVRAWEAKLVLTQARGRGAAGKNRGRPRPPPPSARPLGGRRPASRPSPPGADLPASTLESPIRGARKPLNLKP
jgi:hypothetical protein